MHFTRHPYTSIFCVCEIFFLFNQWIMEIHQFDLNKSDKLSSSSSSTETIWLWLLQRQRHSHRIKQCFCFGLCLYCCLLSSMQVKVCFKINFYIFNIFIKKYFIFLRLNSIYRFVVHNINLLRNRFKMSFFFEWSSICSLHCILEDYLWLQKSTDL